MALVGQALLIVRVSSHARLDMCCVKVASVPRLLTTAHSSILLHIRINSPQLLPCVPPLPFDALMVRVATTLTSARLARPAQHPYPSCVLMVRVPLPSICALSRNSAPPPSLALMDHAPRRTASVPPSPLVPSPPQCCALMARVCPQPPSAPLIMLMHALHRYLFAALMVHAAVVCWIARHALLVLIQRNRCVVETVIVLNLFKCARQVTRLHALLVLPIAARMVDVRTARCCVRLPSLVPLVQFVVMMAHVAHRVIRLLNYQLARLPSRYCVLCLRVVRCV